MPAKRFIPLHARVLVKVNPEATEAGGIHLPEAHRKKELMGRVTETGPEVRELEVGMMVLFPEFGHQVIHIDGVKHLMMEEADVVAIIEA